MPVTIVAVGDIMLGEQPLCEGFGVRSAFRNNGGEFLFEEVSPILRTGDIVFGNLECCLAADDADTNQRCLFLCEGRAARELRAAGFTALSVANNHIMENGRGRFLETIASLREQGITPVGMRGEIPILEVKGYRAALLGYSFVDDGIPDTCYNRYQSEEQVLANIKSIRASADLVIVSLHWGWEYVPYPSGDQVRIARTLIDGGADVILGCHPHVTQGYELYNGGAIIYSLGNFVFDQTFNPPTRESFIAEITIEPFPRKIEIRFTPILIEARSFRPELMDVETAHGFLCRVENVRSSIEQIPSPVYEASVRDYPSRYKEYSDSAKKMMKIHFAKNLHRYPRSSILLLVKKWVGKRTGRGLR